MNVVLSEYPKKSHNFANLIFYDVTLWYSIATAEKNVTGMGKTKQRTKH